MIAARGRRAARAALVGLVLLLAMSAAATGRMNPGGPPAPRPDGASDMRTMQHGDPTDGASSTMPDAPDLDALLPACQPIVIVPAAGEPVAAPMDAPTAGCDVRESFSVKGPAKITAPVKAEEPGTDAP